MADVSDYFNNELPAKLAANPDLSTEVNAVYQFDIGDNIWTVDLREGENKVITGAANNADCVVTCAESDFAGLLDKPASGMMLFTMGKLKVSNVGLALSLQKILS